MNLSAKTMPLMLFDGTTQEFEDIVNRNKLLIYSIVYGITGNFEADDIVQEAFVYAYYHYGTLKDKNKLSSWLCAIARNNAYDSLKRGGRTVSLDVLGKAVSQTTPENIYIKRDEKRQLFTEIFKLSDVYRETIMLYYFAGKNIREISEILSVPEGTIKFRLSESRKKLKKELIDIMGEEKHEIEQKDIFAKIREETEKANKAIQIRDTKAASDICDAVLHEIGDLSAMSREELNTLYSLYSTKIDAIWFAEPWQDSEKYLIKLVEIAEASGDTIWISNTYSFYAAQLSNMGRKDESTKYYKMSLEKAEETGKISVIVDKLYWCGINAYQNTEADHGLLYFKKVIEMKEALFADTEHERNKDSYTLAYSAYSALKRAGDHVSKLTEFLSSVPSISRTDGNFTIAGDPGFLDTNPGGRLEDIFYRITRLEPCLSDKIKEGYIFEQNTFSYSHTPIHSCFEVVSMNETFEAPAGKFNCCLHTRYTNYVADDENDLNKETNGVTDIWYAPNVGVVGVIFIPVAGNRKCLKLLEYRVESTTDAINAELYLPLAVGNRWSYEAFDPNDIPYSEHYEYENLFEVVCVRNFDNAAVIAHSGWCCPKES